jgi:hypothetical protein
MEDFMDMELQRALKEAQRGNWHQTIAWVAASLARAQVPAERIRCFIREAHSARDLGKLLAVCSSHIANLDQERPS